MKKLDSLDESLKVVVILILILLVIGVVGLVVNEIHKSRQCKTVLKESTPQLEEIHKDSFKYLDFVEPQALWIDDTVVIIDRMIAPKHIQAYFDLFSDPDYRKEHDDFVSSVMDVLTYELQYYCVETNRKLNLSRTFVFTVQIIDDEHGAELMWVSEDGLIRSSFGYEDQSTGGIDWVGSSAETPVEKKEYDVEGIFQYEN